MKQDRIRLIVALTTSLAVYTSCTFGWQGPQARETPSIAAGTQVPSPEPSVSAVDILPASSSTPPADIERELQSLEAQVSLLRELDLTTGLPLQVVPPQEFRAGAIESCLAAPSALLPPDTLALLGIPGGGGDPDTLAADWAEGLTSRYDDPTRTIELVDPPADDPTWRLGYVASYLSALRSANLDGAKSAICCPLACASDDDPGLALTALTVGDARLAREQWVRVYGGADDAAQFGSLLEPAEEASLYRAPDFLRETYSFLVTGGRAFVRDLYLSGGWERVDEAYANPPASTEQILHPERYPDDVPVHLEAPDLAAALGPEWELRQSTVLGEWRMRQALRAVLPPDEAIDATTDWGGDVLLTYHNETRQQDLMLLITRWDNLRQAQDFFLAFRKYGEARFGERHPVAGVDTWTWDGGYVVLEHGSDQTLWIMAPDQATADSARSAFDFPVSSR